MNKLNNKHLGGEFDAFLSEEELIAEVEAIALKKVLAWQIDEEMKKQNINKTQMARKMRTSRAAVDRLLDPSNPSLTLKNLERAAHALQKEVRVELVNIG